MELGELVKVVLENLGLGHFLDFNSMQYVPRVRFNVYKDVYVEVSLVN